MPSRATGPAISPHLPTVVVVRLINGRVMVYKIKKIKNKNVLFIHTFTLCGQNVLVSKISARGEILAVSFLTAGPVF